GLSTKPIKYSGFLDRLPGAPGIRGRGGGANLSKLIELDMFMAMGLAIDELERFATALAGAPERWEPLVRHAGEERVYEQIWDDPDVNAWVICWSEDQDTGYHDHDESAAAVA